METNYYQSDLAIHPGEFLEETLEDLGMSQIELSDRIGRPTQAINEIIKGKKSITSATALELEDVLNVPAHIWVGLESEYQMVKARQAELQQMEEETALLPKFAYPELAQLENKTPYSVDYRRLHESGEYRWQRSQGMALFNDKGKAYRMVGSIQDIHKQKQAEEEKARLQNRLQQSQRIESLGTLAEGIAHDFNNILYNIIGYAETALFHQLPEGHPACYSLEEILKASDRATDLVKQIHTFSRKKKQERIKF